MAWDIHEEFRVEATGTSDIPRFPVPETLLFTINAPVFPIFIPIFLTGAGLTLQYLAFLPFVVAWWWWLGTRLDFGWLGKKPNQYPAWTKSFTALLALALLFLAIKDFLNFGEYISAMVRYGSPAALSPVKTLGAGLWCGSLALIAAGTTRSLSRASVNGSPNQINQRGQTVRFSSAGFWLVTFAALFDLFAQLRGSAIEWTRPPQPPRVFSTVSGSLNDENGKPLDNVLVELLREGGGDDTGPRLEMTKSGRYSFNVRPGAYRLALNCHGCLDAPTAEHPFQTSFYPGVEQEVEAARIVVMAQKPIHLNPWHVHRLPVTAIPAQANWLNGTAAEVSSLVVDNLDYPGAIVESIPSGRGGKGPILLPVGFNYRARASVVCDDGKKLSFHESRPLLEFTVRPGLTPKTLKFVIPELPCKAWHPK